MEVDPFSPADLDKDGDCDDTDRTLFESFIGKCQADLDKREITVEEVDSDFDVDGCVTERDREIFMQFFVQPCRPIDTDAVEEVSPPQAHQQP